MEAVRECLQRILHNREALFATIFWLLFLTKISIGLAKGFHKDGEEEMRNYQIFIAVVNIALVIWLIVTTLKF